MARSSMALRALLSTVVCLLLLPTILSQSTTWSYCYYIVGTANSVSYTTAVSGSIITSSTPVTVNGRSAYNVTGITGTRTYNDAAGRSSVTTISGVAPTNSNFTTPDQVVYATWPSIDDLGLLYTFTGTAQTPYGPVSGSPVIRLWVDAINYGYGELVARTRFNEEMRESNGSVVDWDSTGGNFVLLNDGGTSATAGTVANQCSLTYGTATTYSFCYYATTDPSTNAASTYTLLTTGTLTATGPITRRGRTAYIVQSATGTRTLTTGITATTTGTNQSQSIVGVRGIDQDENSGFLYNDNAIYQSSPFLDDEGLVLILDSNARYPNNKTVATTDVQLFHGDVQQLYNEITPFVGSGFDYAYVSSNRSYFQVSNSVSAAVLGGALCQYTVPSNGAGSLSGAAGVSWGMVLSWLVVMIAMKS